MLKLSYFNSPYGYVFLVYVLIEFISVISDFSIKHKTSKNDDKSNVKPEKNSLVNDSAKKSREIVVIILYIISMFIIVYFTPKISVLYIAFMSISFFFMFFTMLFSLVEVFCYIFKKPYNYQLSKNIEGSLNITGILFLFTSNNLKELSNTFSKELTNSPAYVLDILKGTPLVLWYFMLYFLISTYIVLILNKCFVFLSRTKLFNSKATSKFFAIRNPELIRLTSKFEHRFDINNYHSFNSKLLVHMLWLLIAIFDSTIGLIISIIWYLFIVLTTIIYTFLKSVLKVIKNLNLRLAENLGRTIIIISRYAIVLALISVIFLDKYETLFTDAGSEIFEFICSVVIIPFAISQIVEIRNYVVKKEES